MRGSIIENEDHGMDLTMQCFGNNLLLHKGLEIDKAFALSADSVDFAMSEREKILEYANRHWQTRLENNLPLATGRAPYGWQWKDEEKTRYIINKEEAAVRISIFTMFVDEDMSLRGITNKLTEDGILPPAKSRGVKVKKTGWCLTTVRKLLTDPENIGALRICKSTKVLTANGTPTRIKNTNMKTIPGGIPAIVPAEVYELV